MRESERKPEVPADAVAAIREGNKVRAIKLTRVATGLGLKDSKELVEALIERDPGLKHTYESNVTSGGSCLALLVALAAAGAMLWFALQGGA